MIIFYGSFFEISIPKYLKSLSDVESMALEMYKPPKPNTEQAEAKRPNAKESSEKNKPDLSMATSNILRPNEHAKVKEIWK